eukprot:CFRG1216T1
MAADKRYRPNSRHVSQETFDEAVDENMSLFDMSREDAIEETREQFMTQGVDLSNITNSEGEETTFTWSDGAEPETAVNTPHIVDERERLFLQTDAELIARKKYMEMVNYDKGGAIKLPCKVLCAQSWISPMVFVGGAENSVRKVDISTNTTVKVLKKQMGPISALATTEGLLVTGSWDKSILVWDTSNFTVLYNLIGHSDYIKSLCIMGNVLFSGGADKTLIQWDLSTGKRVRTFQRLHRRSIEAICVGPDADIVYTASSDGTIRMWDVRTGVCEGEITGHDTSVYCMVLSGDNILYTGSADKTVRRWDVVARQQTAIFKHKDWVTALCIVGSALCTGLRNGQIMVWDADDVKEPPVSIVGHFDQVTSIFQPMGDDTEEGRRIISGSLDGTVRQWQIHTPATHTTLAE